MNHGAQVKSDALELASWKNEKEVLELLLSHIDDSSKASGLFHSACSYGDTHLDILKMFLNITWDANGSYSKGGFPLLLACRSSNKSAEVFSLLLSAGAAVSVEYGMLTRGTVQMEFMHRHNVTCVRSPTKCWTLLLLQDVGDAIIGRLPTN